MVENRKENHYVKIYRLYILFLCPLHTDQVYSLPCYSYEGQDRLVEFRGGWGGFEVS